jgi:hypothetical protein
MNGSLNILLGAGFSYYAGLPLARDIQSKFDRSLSNQLLRFGSSEWAWFETQNSVMQHNGRTGSDALEYEFILEEIIKDYKENNHNTFFDYEDFYQYVIDNTTIDGWYENIIKTSSTRFYSETELKDENSEYYGYAFKNIQRYLPSEIINYLIMDLLGVKLDAITLVNRYKTFLNYINKYDEVNIFSLNHDRVLEYLFKHENVNYSDGFSCENSSIQYDGKLLRIFQNEFNNSVRLIKLHGSIDMYAFEHGTEINNVVTRDGNHTYFKPDDYRAKHYAIRIDPSTGRTLQRYNSNITPKFITGKNKHVLISSDYMYSKLHKMFQNKVTEGNELLIIGYSFGDPHINAVLNGFTTSIGPCITNFNYRDNFPYLAPKIKEIRSFQEL